MVHGQVFFALVNPIVALLFSISFAAIGLRWPEYRHLPILALAFLCLLQMVRPRGLPSASSSDELATYQVLIGNTLVSVSWGKACIHAFIQYTE